MASDPARIQAVFAEVILKHSPVERSAYLDDACRDNPALRDRVEALLRAYDEAGDFLQPPTRSTPPPPIHERPGTVIGPYKLLQQIGEGGFGMVFMAEQERPIVRKVALKIIKLGMDTRQVIARFEAERQALAMMDHPNIAKVLDAGATESGRPYFVMELVRGIPITEYADTNKLDTRARLELFTAVCRAVQHAHQKGIIHRDIKPSNVLVTMHDGVPVPKVIDFGIAKATSGRLTDKTLFTEYRQFIGTPEYMSPEQAEMSALDVDTRSDIYSLGVLLYELLTGTTPFDPEKLRSATYAEIQRIIREVEPPRPSTRVSTLGNGLAKVAEQRRTDAVKLGRLMRGELDWIVMRCLEKDRTRRYDTANGLAADVQRYLKDEAVEASPPSKTYKLRKLARKYRRPLRVAAVVALLLIASTIMSAWQAARARRAEVTVSSQLIEVEARRQEAQRQRDEAVDANRRADAANRRTREMAAEQCADNGLRAAQADDPGLALLWFAKALKLDADDPERAMVQRQRFSLAYRKMPQPLDVVPDDIGRSIKSGFAIRADATIDLVDARTGSLVRRLYNDEAADLDGTFAEFTNDGKYVIAACNDNKVRVWERETGRETCPPLPFDDDRLLEYQIASSPDSKHVFTVHDHHLHLNEIEGGKALWPPIPLGPDEFHEEYVQFTPDGRPFTEHFARGLRIWDMKTGKLATSLPFGRSAFSPDGRYCAIDQTVYDAMTGTPASHLQVPPNIATASPCWSRDGKYIATGLWVYEAQSGRRILQPNPAAGFYEFSPDGKWMLTVNSDDRESQLALYDVRTWTPTWRTAWHFPVARPDLVGRAEFSPDSQRIVLRHYATGRNATIGMIDCASGDHVQTLIAPTIYDSCISSRDGTRVTSLTTLQTWSFDFPMRVDIGDPNAARFGGSGAYAQFGADGRLLVTKDGYDTLRAWDAATAEPLTPPFRRDDGVRLRYFSFADDDGLIDLGGVLFDLRRGARREEHAPPAIPPAVPLARNGDGRFILAEIAGTFRLWDKKTNQIVGQPLRQSGAVEHIKDASFSSDSGRVVVVSLRDHSREGQACLWEVPSGRAILLEGMSDLDVESASFSPDGAYLVTHSYYGSQLWSAATGRQVRLPGDANDGDVVDNRRACFSPDSKRLLVSDAGVAKVWDLRANVLVSTLQSRTEAIRFSNPRFSPTGKLVLGSDGVWHADSGELISFMPVTALSLNEKQLLQGDTELMDFSPLTQTPAQLQALAELMSGRRLNERGHPESLDVITDRSELLKSCPELFRERPRNQVVGIGQRYRDAVEARLTAANTDPQRRALVKSLALAADLEVRAGLFQHAVFIAEHAARLDPSNLAAQDNLAMAYLSAGRLDDAYEIYRRFKGGRYEYEGGQRVFGESAFRNIRMDDVDHTVLSNIKALLAPTTRATTREAYGPGNR